MLAIARLLFNIGARRLVEIQKIDAGTLRFAFYSRFHPILQQLLIGATLVT
jgi:hypothetical protein